MFRLDRGQISEFMRSQSVITVCHISERMNTPLDHLNDEVWLLICEVSTVIFLSLCQTNGLKQLRTVLTRKSLLGKDVCLDSNTLLMRHAGN